LKEQPGKILLYDCFSGISGDMHIGALVDLGVPEMHLQEQLSRLSLADEFTLHLTTGKKMGISGTLATVELHAGEDSHPPLRHLSDIREIIHSAQYSTAVTTLALDIFQEIAVAEAKVHGTTPELIHFHEVGATDSIVDIVAAAICLDYLDLECVCASAVELGAGMVKCAHGLMPVPAPATAEILKDIPCSLGRVQGEATTPTGAAILKTVISETSPPKDFLIHKVGYGIGQKDFEVPNVLRVMLGERVDHALNRSHSTGHYVDEEAIQIECNVDDMSPEAFQPLVEGLFSRGAMDVSLSSVIMKKSRPGHNICVLCSRELKNSLVDYLFENSTTIGLREYPVKKTMLPRENMNISTSFGPVAVKVATLDSGERKWKVEFDEVKALAEKHDMDYLNFKGLIDTEVEAALKRLFVTS
jgi:uncharacterized protein (TIGR00299 family) protein